jgi:hypothetical protein
MQTSAVKANYNLTEDGYRAEVRAATGPVSRERSISLPIGDLTPEARLAIADGEKYQHQWGNPSSIDMPASDTPPDAGAVSAALVDRADRRRQAELDRLRRVADADAEKIRKDRERILQWETNPGALLSQSSDGTWDYPRPQVSSVHWPDREAFIERLRVMAEERNEARQAKEMARIAACNAELAKYAAAVPANVVRAASAKYAAAAVPANVVRAASEGRDTRKVWMAWAVKLVDEIAHECSRVIASGDRFGNATSYGESERADVPTVEAYRALDLATGIAKTRCEGLLPLPFALTVGPIARHDIAPRGASVWRTGVEITVSCPWLDRTEGVVILAEPRDQGDDNDDE